MSRARSAIAFRRAVLFHPSIVNLTECAKDKLYELNSTYGISKYRLFLDVVPNYINTIRTSPFHSWLYNLQVAEHNLLRRMIRRAK
jgi:hypothetical protein